MHAQQGGYVLCVCAKVNVVVVRARTHHTISLLVYVYAYIPSRGGMYCTYARKSTQWYVCVRVCVCGMHNVYQYTCAHKPSLVVSKRINAHAQQGRGVCDCARK